MSVQFTIAVTHLVSRKRPTLVSLVGIALGVAFFLAVSSLMRGSERDFIKRLVDNSPHLTVYDEYRNPQPQPATLRWPAGAVELRRVKPPLARSNCGGSNRCARCAGFAAMPKS